MSGYNFYSEYGIKIVTWCKLVRVSTQIDDRRWHTTDDRNCRIADRNFLGLSETNYNMVHFCLGPFFPKSWKMSIQAYYKSKKVYSIFMLFEQYSITFPFLWVVWTAKVTKETMRTHSSFAHENKHCFHWVLH